MTVRSGVQLGRVAGAMLLLASLIHGSGQSALADHAPDCGPPAEDIPGPPAWAINVGAPMPDPWLLCYIWHDLELQDYQPQYFVDIQRVPFSGYPVECANDISPEAGRGTTSGLQVELIATGDEGRQTVRFVYRIQDDGDYINNCYQQLLFRPENSEMPNAASSLHGRRHS